jgi:hypothetical protein
MLLRVLLLAAAAVVLGPPAAAGAARGRGDAATAARRLRAAHGLDLPWNADPSGSGMLAWLRGNGGVAELRVAVGADGVRGAVAARAFRAGNFVLSVPLELAIDLGHDNLSSAEHAAVRSDPRRMARERRECRELPLPTCLRAPQAHAHAPKKPYSPRRTRAPHAGGARSGR